jgi:hypothetical protein
MQYPVFVQPAKPAVPGRFSPGVARMASGVRAAGWYLATVYARCAAPCQRIAACAF